MSIVRTVAVAGSRVCPENQDRFMPTFIVRLAAVAATIKQKETRVLTVRRVHYAKRHSITF